LYRLWHLLWKNVPAKKIPDAFEMGYGTTAPLIAQCIPQAVPGKPRIDAEHCTKLLNGQMRDL
jgi:heterodisulfide reductase subunit A-like polyferredoxin